MDHRTSSSLGPLRRALKEARNPSHKGDSVENQLNPSSSQIVSNQETMRLDGEVHTEMEMRKARDEMLNLRKSVQIDHSLSQTLEKQLCPALSYSDAEIAEFLNKVQRNYGKGKQHGEEENVENIHITKEIVEYASPSNMVPNMSSSLQYSLTNYEFLVQDKKILYTVAYYYNLVKNVYQVKLALVVPWQGYNHPQNFTLQFLELVSIDEHTFRLGEEKTTEALPHQFFNVKMQYLHEEQVFQLLFPTWEALVSRENILMKDVTNVSRNHYIGGHHDTKPPLHEVGSRLQVFQRFLPYEAKYYFTANSHDILIFGSKVHIYEGDYVALKNEFSLIRPFEIMKTLIDINNGDPYIYGRVFLTVDDIREQGINIPEYIHSNAEGGRKCRQSKVFYTVKAKVYHTNLISHVIDIFLKRENYDLWGSCISRANAYFCEYFFDIFKENSSNWMVLATEGDHPAIKLRMARSHEYTKKTQALPSLITHPQSHMSVLAFKLQLANKIYDRLKSTVHVRTGGHISVACDANLWANVFGPWVDEFPPTYSYTHIAMTICGVETLRNALFSTWSSFPYREKKSEKNLHPDRAILEDKMTFKYYDSPP
jgi:hypothetical protein